VYFAGNAPLVPATRCAVFTAVPLVREMMAWAMRWGPERSSEAPIESAFFTALGALACTWAESPLPFSLPVAKSPELSRALDYMLAHLDEDVDITQTAKVAGMSTRTLARRFQDEMGMGFREVVRKARMLRAMELFAAPSARVTDVALAVGFDSPAAFTRAFAAFSGQRPKDYCKASRPR
jgi:AraC-like DNA-binding protein